MPADNAGVAGCVSATVTAICDARGCGKSVMVMKPAVRVVGVGLMSLSADTKSGYVHGLVECRHIKREDDKLREKKKFQREMEERSERCARAHTGRPGALFVKGDTKEKARGRCRLLVQSKHGESRGGEIRRKESGRMLAGRGLDRLLDSAR